MRYEIDAKEYQVTEINTTDEPCLKFLNEINAVTTNRFQIITNFEALMNYVKQTNKQTKQQNKNNKNKTRILVFNATVVFWICKYYLT